MTCVNIVDHRAHCTKQVDAVVELVPQAPSNPDEIHSLKLFTNTTVEKVMKFAQRIKHPVVIFLYSSGTLDKS